MTSSVLNSCSYPTFGFERFADPTGDWIPLIVRMKLDLSQRKITLDDWQALMELQRQVLQSEPVDNADQVNRFARTLTTMLAEVGREPKPLSPDKGKWVAEWNQPIMTPRKVADVCRRHHWVLNWQNLDRYSRYVFWCLARKGDIDSFRSAYEEVLP